jgi:hypothetical protein
MARGDSHISGKVWAHLGVMLCLYIGQGFFQGLCGTVGTVLMESRELSLIESSNLAGAALPFSIKIFWAPIVDGVFPQMRTRRPFWIVSTQVLLLAMFGWLAMRPDLFADASQFDTLVAAVYALAFLSATQDVAVDAWTIEGVPPVAMGMQPTVQTIGLLTGIAATRVFSSLIGRGVVSVSTWLSSVVVIYALVTVIVIVYLFTAASREALRLGLEAAAESGPLPTVRSVLRDAAKIVREPWCRSLCIALVCASVHHAATTVFAVQARNHLHMDVTFFADLALAGMGVQFVTSAVVSALISRWGVTLSRQAVWLRHALTVEVIIAVTYVTAYCAAATFDSSILTLLTLVGLLEEAVGATSFCLSCTVIGRASAKNAAATGTTVTLLNCLSNAGRIVMVFASARVLGVVIQYAPAIGALPGHAVAFAAVGGGFALAGAVLMRATVGPAFAKAANLL